MGESTCLMQQPFSHPSDTFHEPQEGNPIRALGESVSFGRFMTESLAWEKWSSFNHNRYLEEVEKYSKPGSVAQKKAYFEEHYKKKLAAKKAAEEENSVTNGVCGNRICDTGGSNCHANTEESTEVEREVEVSTSEEVPIPFDGETVGVESIEVEVEPVKENLVLGGSSALSGSPNQREDVEIRVTKEVEIHTMPPSEKLPLKEISSANQQSLAPTRKIKPGGSSSKALVYNRESKLPFSPARPRTPVNPRKENNPSLSSKKTTKESVDRRRPTPTSLHMSLNFTSSRADDSSKTATPVIKNSKDSRGIVSSTRTSKDCSRSLRTPARASGNGVPKPPPLTPYLDSKRTKAPLEHSQHTHGSRTVDVKWKSLSVDRLKSSSAFEDKSWSPSISSSFTLRSEERAAKRKEYFQKLEEEHNAKEAQKVQLQAQSKEKAENELRKLRQNLGFKAKPMPDFYREPQLPKTQLKKIPLTRPRSPKLGRKTSSSPIQDSSSLPPKTPLVKSDGSKQATDRATRTPTPKRNARENASPNIQT